MNITLAVDERVVEQARKVAHAMGKSLNQAVRDYLEHLAGAQAVAEQLRLFEDSVRETPGRLDGWRFNRHDANARA